MTVRADVTLSHSTGPVKITIEAATPAVAAFVANAVKDRFNNKKQTPPDRPESYDELMRRLFS